MIPYGKHDINQKDIDAVVDVLENHFLTQGEKVPLFEQVLAEQCQAGYAIAVNSGTSALHIACLAAGVSDSDIVWTSPVSFVASANCALYCGASIDFVDIDPLTRNMCVQALAIKLEVAKQQNQLPKAIVLVHYSGQSCDMQIIRQLTQEFNIVLIEDASHALGATYQGKPVGCCEYSDMSVLSFHPVKGVTTAEGGAVTTNQAQLMTQLSLFGKHGITRDPSLMEGEYKELNTDSPWYYQQLALGYNYRMSDLHAALGISQLNRLPEFIQKRRMLAQRYMDKLVGLPICLPGNEALLSSAWHIFVIELKGHDRQTVFLKLRERGIGVNVHYIPIHLNPFYQKLGFQPGDFPTSEQFYKMALTLPLYPSLSTNEQDFVVESLSEVLK